MDKNKLEKIKEFLAIVGLAGVTAASSKINVNAQSIYIEEPKIIYDSSLDKVYVLVEDKNGNQVYDYEGMKVAFTDRYDGSYYVEFRGSLNEIEKLTNHEEVAFETVPLTATPVYNVSGMPTMHDNISYKPVEEGTANIAVTNKAAYEMLSSVFEERPPFIGEVHYLNRAQYATMLYNFAGLNGIDIYNVNKSSFADIDEYFISYLPLNFAYQNGLLTFSEGMANPYGEVDINIVEDSINKLLSMKEKVIENKNIKVLKK